MRDEFKQQLADVVKSATEVLTDEEALAIIQICKAATNREIANVTEQILMESIEKHGEGDKT